MANIPIRVRIKKVRTLNQTSFVWPQGYDYKKFNVLAYEAPDETVTLRRDMVGEMYEWCVAVVEENLGTRLSNTYPADYDICTTDEANTYGRTYRPQVVKIFDKKKVIEILDKVFKLIPLTPEELELINPDNPAAAVRKSKLFDINDSL